MPQTRIWSANVKPGLFLEQSKRASSGMCRAYGYYRSKLKHLQGKAQEAKAGSNQKSFSVFDFFHLTLAMKYC
jgi:hypothetical protein